MTEVRLPLPPLEFPPGEELDPKKSRKDYFSLNDKGEPDWDMAKIYPDPQKLEQFWQDMESLKDFHAMALKYPRWAALTSTPADVVYYNQPSGHHACV